MFWLLVSWARMIFAHREDCFKEDPWRGPRAYFVVTMTMIYLSPQSGGHHERLIQISRHFPSRIWRCNHGAKRWLLVACCKQSRSGLGFLKSALATRIFSGAKSAPPSSAQARRAVLGILRGPLNRLAQPIVLSAVFDSSPHCAVGPLAFKDARDVAVHNS